MVRPVRRRLKKTVLHGNETVTIREVTTEDLDLLNRFFRENDAEAILRHFHPFPLTLETAVNIACAEHKDHYYGMFLADRMIGLSMLRGWEEGYAVPSFGILIDRQFHGMGIGRKMTEFTIGEARKLGCKRMRLSVYASNEAALRLYRSLGFEENHRAPVILEGEQDDRIIMIKDL
jgi:ribosomal protein S18 acetylase RimI-like enzyme